MAFGRKNFAKISQYKTRQEMNIGILIFTLILIYLIVTIFTYATSKRISTYEVRRGSIVRDNSYNGLILRQEVTAAAESKGYISFFRNENSKVKKGSNIYAISPMRLDTEVSTETEAFTPGDEVQKKLTLKTQNFNENFSPQKFSSVYTLKKEMTEILSDASNQSKMMQLDTLIAQNGGNIHVSQSASDGILVRTIDGYENVSEGALKVEDFDRTSYSAVRLEDQAEVQAGEIVYKLVTGEEWTVYIQLDKGTAEELADTTYIKTRIDKDNETVWADFSILQIDGSYYGKLVFDNSMIRYAEDRFLNIELILEQESGLKIPKSAVIEKEFYVVPAEYLASNKSGTAQGVMIEKKNDEDGTVESVFQAADIYYMTEDGDFYLNPDDFPHHTSLLKPGSSETFLLREKKKLPGVYNVNQGYAVFRRVLILCENADYYIVEEGTSYSLSNYDHIVLDGNMVEASEVVFQ
ncbi:hypothetical protein C824_000680 [Schaedlerella arabinosiphila]|nr:hypothetical protein C824_000680 [Schaedlerella arabinosiphila]